MIILTDLFDEISNYVRFRCYLSTIMMKSLSKKYLHLVSICLFFIFTGCETTSTSYKIDSSVSKKNTIIKKLDPKFELITTYKSIEKIKKDFGEFTLQRTDENLIFYRLDRGNCRVFILGKANNNEINNIMVYHVNKKKFFPKFNLKKCIS